MRDFFEKRNIEYFSLVPLSRLKVIKPYLLEKNGFDQGSNVIMMLLPYRSEIKPQNLTVYASVPDYHLFVKNLALDAENYVKSKYPNAKFKLFADHSPIDEVHAACISGLGFIGDNGLLINEKYSSFVFLCECITDLGESELGLSFCKSTGVSECLHCGRCAHACPSSCICQGDARLGSKKECLSALTQKKGAFTPEEERFIVENGSVWGCDICQNVCPYTLNASYTPIEFFKRGVIPLLTLDTLSSLSEDEFNTRPFAWRGYDTILRNVTLYEKNRREFEK